QPVKQGNGEQQGEDHFRDIDAPNGLCQKKLGTSSVIRRVVPGMSARRARAADGILSGRMKLNLSCVRWVCRKKLLMLKSLSANQSILSRVHLTIRAV